MKFGSKKPRNWYCCNHFEQYSAARPYFPVAHSQKVSCLWQTSTLHYSPQTCSKNSKNDSSEDCEVHNCLEKHLLLTLWRMQSQFWSVVGFSPSHQNLELDGMTSQKNTGCQEHFQNGGLHGRILGFIRDKFLQNRTHRNVDEWKSWMSTCSSWRKRSKLFGMPSPLITWYGAGTNQETWSNHL